MNKYVGFSADFAGQYASVEGKNASDYQFMFGPSFGYHSGTARPFARVLFGGDRLGRFGNSDTSYAIGFGGGLDLKTTKAVSLRIAQFDYIRTNHFDVAQNNLRFSAGIVFNLGESK